MEERYPYIRFVIDAAPMLAGAVGIIALVGGTVSSCHRGGVAGLIGFVTAIVVACVGYVGVMVSIESLRIAVDIERGVRQLVAAPGQTAPPSDTAA
jgi:hypothetical protein